MNPTIQDAQARNSDSTAGVDQPFHGFESPELIDVADPTEDLANDVTSELPGQAAGPRLVPPQLTHNDGIVANDDVAEDAPPEVAPPEVAPPEVAPPEVAPPEDTRAMTTGAVLRERYILGLPIGHGGTSIVYQAQDLRRAQAAGMGGNIAIKLLRPEFRDQPRCVARLRREFQQTQSMAHPNVVRFHDLDCDRGNWFIAMELLVGETLGRRLRHEAPAGLGTAEALRIAAACGEALLHAHERGITHGDVKPDNIFVTTSGDVRLLDFGVAPDSIRPPYAGDEAIADPVPGAATRAYASPQILSGLSPESRDDVFGLACLTYEMLAGKHPYGRQGADDAWSAGLQVERLPGISVHQWRALASGLAWRREDRPAIRELLRDLADDAPETAPVPEVVPIPVQVVQGESAHRPRRRWLGPAGIGLAIVLGVLLGRYVFDPQGDSRPEDAASLASAVSNAPPPAATGSTPITDADMLARLAPPMPQVAQAPALARESQVSQVPGLIAFDSATMVVSNRAVVAPLPLRHSGTARRSVTVAWRVLDGTAVAGRDYGGPQSGVAHFAEGHTFRMIYVPIVGNRRDAGERSFTVELTNASPGASLGMTSRIVVTIQDDA